MILRYTFLSLLVAGGLHAAMLPGFRVETIARADGFVSSIAIDSKGTIYLTTTDGWIHRVDGPASTRVASLPTHAGGNGGLLGMVLLDDDTAAVHYTTWSGNSAFDQVLDDVVSRVDLATGNETVLHAFVCDIENRLNGASSEHHGGNLTLGPDGSLFLGIGDYGTHIIAQKPEWNAGKIWKIDADGTLTQWARGLRNPYDLAWDPDFQRVVVGDNGPVGGDELHVVAEGENCGWPNTFGEEPPLEGAVAPVYTFPVTVAPTGLLRLDGSNALLDSGYLIGAFVTRALYYLSSIATARTRGPVAVVDEFHEFIIDVTHGPDGAIYFVSATGSGSSVQRLHVPARGDCNGDGLINWRDLSALKFEIADHENGPMIHAQNGAHAGSWGCDVNADGLINEVDLEILGPRLTTRRRSVRSR